MEFYDTFILLFFILHLFIFLPVFLENSLGTFDLLMLCGDTESNPGLRSNSGETFPICHWNLNSITAHNISKISCLRT